MNRSLALISNGEATASPLYFAANLNDAEKGGTENFRIRISEQVLEDMKRFVVGGRKVKVEMEEGDVGSSSGVEKVGGGEVGVEVDVTEQERIDDKVFEEDENPGTVISSDDEMNSQDENKSATSKGKKRREKDNGYERIIRKNYEEYPQGWPRLAGFMNSSSSFAIWRRFGTAHNRVLLHLQATITLLEKQLDELDKADEGNEDMLYRLRRNEWKEGWDTAQKDILEEMRQKLLQYDELLLKDYQLRSLPRAPMRDFLSVFHWIYGRKPLDIGQYDFIYHRDDFVSSGNHGKTPFDHFVESCVSQWPESRFHRSLRDRKQPHGATDEEVRYFSGRKLALFAKFLVICVAITILLIPVFVLALVNMSRGVTVSVVLIFTLIFATLMSLLTGTRPEGVFVGTCTYAALLVVFLSNVQGRSVLVGNS